MAEWFLVIWIVSGTTQTNLTELTDKYSSKESCEYHEQISWRIAHENKTEIKTLCIPVQNEVEF